MKRMRQESSTVVYPNNKFNEDEQAHVVRVLLHDYTYTGICISIFLGVDDGGSSPSSEGLKPIGLSYFVLIDINSQGNNNNDNSNNSVPKFGFTSQ